MLKIRCPGCGKEYDIPETMAGKPLRCPQCRSSLPAVVTDTTRLHGSDTSDLPTAAVSAVAPVAAPAPPGLPIPFLDAPKNIGRFEIRGQLGAGAFGTVYRAWDPKLEREIALKVARPDIVNTPQRIERFQREAKAAARLQHPNIVPVFEVGSEGRNHFIVSPLIGGQTLDQAIEAHAISFRRAAEIIRDLAYALTFAHAHGVVHRDVKPHNILLDEQGKPFLTDFGLAHRQDADQRLTRMGAVLGTPAYMAPEQAAGAGTLQPGWDQYALGAVYYHALTGRPPFSGPPALVLVQVKTQEPPRPSQINSAIPLDLEAICLKAMARRPEHRYASCRELGDALSAWLAKARYRAKQKFTVAAVVVGLGLVAIAIWMLSQRGPEPNPQPGEPPFANLPEPVSPGSAFLRLSPLPDVTLKKGERVTLEIQLDSRGLHDPIHVRIDGLPAKVFANSIHVEPGQKIAALLLAAEADAEDVERIAIVHVSAGKFAISQPVRIALRNAKSEKKPGSISAWTKNRVNPTILAMGSKNEGELREIQIDYFPAPALIYDIDPAKKEFRAVVFSDNGSFVPTVTLDPKRMVVVRMTFPIKEQLELFREALRYPSVKLMLENGESPRFLGLNVWRSQIDIDGKATKPVPLYQYDNKHERTVVHSVALDAFFRKMKIDDDNAQQWANYLGPNMVTPLPKLAAVQRGDANYPTLRLMGLPGTAADEPEAPTPAEPDTKGKTGYEFLGKKIKIRPAKEIGGIIRPKKWQELPTDLRARVNGNYNVFDPLGRPLKKDKNAKDELEKNRPTIGSTSTPKSKREDDEQREQMEITRLLGRFIDVEAEVGKTYCYSIQVRVANPNFGRVQEVAHQDLSKVAELVSDWAITPWVTVPGETYFYVVDQLAFPEKTESVPGMDGVDKDKVDADKTVVQIHRWIDKEDGRLIADWAVAERLVIRRGEVIGHPRLMVEVPEWNIKTSQFKLGFDFAKRKKRIPGIPVSFNFGDPPPVLVDFTGGRFDHRTGKTIIKHDGAVEMLVLTPEGNLIVRNSRIDSDPTTEIGRFRFMHYARWRNRVRAVRELPVPINTGGGFPVK